MEELTITSLRSDIYAVADKVINKKISIRVKRKNQYFRLVPEGKIDKLSNLKKRNTIVGDPDELVDLNLSTWDELENL